MSVKEYGMMEFTRGNPDKPEWKCKVVIIGGQVAHYHDIETPEGASPELKQIFLEEAETAALKKLESLDDKN